LFTLSAFLQRSLKLHAELRSCNATDNRQLQGTYSLSNLAWLRQAIETNPELFK
jgi:hypothetical protein